MTLHVISLFDFTGYMLEPWADIGFDCYAYDLKHVEPTIKNGINFYPWDAWDGKQTQALVERHKDRCYLVTGFPPCTDLALSGTRHWSKKGMADYTFQDKAVWIVRSVDKIAEAMGAGMWMTENPVGPLSKFWRPFDFSFHPYEFGGYLPFDDHHPHFPEYIPPRDAYRKKTCIWHSPSFYEPERKPVPWVEASKGFSPQTQSLGGKSEKTKEIRSATPRGFVQAVFESNCPRL